MVESHMSECLHFILSMTTCGHRAHGVTRHRLQCQLWLWYCACFIFVAFGALERLASEDCQPVGERRRLLSVSFIPMNHKCISTPLCAQCIQRILFPASTSMVVIIRVYSAVSPLYTEHPTHSIPSIITLVHLPCVRSVMDCVSLSNP